MSKRKPRCPGKENFETAREAQAAIARRFPFSRGFEPRVAYPCDDCRHGPRRQRYWHIAHRTPASRRLGMRGGRR